MLALLSTLARAADVPPVWDWSTPRRYRLTADERQAPPISVALANNIMVQMSRYTVNLDVTCAQSNEPAAGGATTVACSVDDAAVTGFATYESDRADLDESMRQLETWLRGATLDFVQRDDGVIKRVGEQTVPSGEQTVHSGAQMPGGSLKLHITARTRDQLTFEGEHGDIASISVEFDRRARSITESHVYYAMVGNTANHHWSREFTSELLDGPEVADEP